ncbi:MAG TPA: choice-of-anchor Q domain-containing protein [Anaerolineales bacterium]
MVNKDSTFRFIWRSYPVLIAAIVVGMVLFSWPGVQVQASGVITVNTTADNLKNDGSCTLREAVIAANKDAKSGMRAGECSAGSGADVILIPAGVYELTRTDSGNEDASATGDLDISGDVTFEATEPGVVIMGNAGFTDRIIHVLSGDVIIHGLTIKGGKVGGDGGGIYNLGSVTIANTTLSENTASNNGGGIYNAGSLSLTNSTLSGNIATSAGGGLFNNGSSDLNYVTIANNSAASGGGIANQNSLFAANSIVANNIPTESNCSGAPLASAGHNLESGNSCSFSLPSDLINTAPVLGPLVDNGGLTPTHALLLGSPAIDAGIVGACGVDTDQRGAGFPRPQGAACDIGAFEVQGLGQPGPIFTVNTDQDVDDGVCSFDHCSLSEAINAANNRPNDVDSPDRIIFDIAGQTTSTIAPQSALPSITDALIVDGNGQIVLDGTSAGTDVSGLVLNADNSSISGLEITNFSADGIQIFGTGNSVTDNVISGNGGNGVGICTGTGNEVTGNDIHSNDGVSIDLGCDGETPNDSEDVDEGANHLQNFPQLIRAEAVNGALTVTGFLDSTPNTSFRIDFYESAQCNQLGGGTQTLIGSTNVLTDERGNVYFTAENLDAVPDGHFINATATAPGGNTSEYSACISVGPGNDSWPGASTLSFSGNNASADGLIDQLGQSRWYKFNGVPNSRVIVTLTNLAVNYDLTVYTDIRAAFEAIVFEGSSDLEDLTLLSAEFAADAFSADAFSADAFSADAFSADAFSADAFSADAFSADAFSADAFSADAFSADAFSADAFSADAFSADAFSADAFSADAFSADAFSADAFSADAFSSAQNRSLIGVSAFDGTVGEGIAFNTWNRDGDFYVRVRGRNGGFDLTQPFHLAVSVIPGSCAQVTREPALPGNPNFITPSSGGYKTIILADSTRMPDVPMAKIQEFADRPEVSGVIVDVGQDDGVAALNAQADDKLACPYAKNLVAGAIKEIVDSYGELNPLEYVVIIGNDDAIPFYRHPDNALLANEKGYIPPVRDNTASQASLKLGYVLGQDAYGADTSVDFKNTSLPIPQLAVGRLVETGSEVTTMLDAYLGTANGVVAQPDSALFTGYDFLEDSSLAIQAEIESGLPQNATKDALITDNEVSPLVACDDTLPATTPLSCSWTAQNLKDLLFTNRYDLIYLAGHFTANSALAADYSTRVLASELDEAPVDLTNSLVFSPGCHSGYNIVNDHGVPGVTREPDWAQVFARKGATLVAGTGYQYGDTNFMAYSEILYHNFSQQLNAGGVVAIGKALNQAKVDFLAETPQVRGIHEKAYLEATLFGLPMLSIQLSGGQGGDPAGPPLVSGTSSFESDPGAFLGLKYADVSVTPQLAQHSVTMVNPSTGATETATYLSGKDGILTNSGEPVLPLELFNASLAELVLRGVGFRGGAYTDLPDILPYTGAAVTEIRGVHAPFPTAFFYPVSLWSVNYFDVLSDPEAGTTRLMVTPAQHQESEGDPTKSTLRSFSEMDFRLYYSANTATYGGGSIPADAIPPVITQVSAPVVNGDVLFDIIVTGNPSAGIQEVWVIYTALDGPLSGQWQPLDLSQSAVDSKHWEGVLSAADLMGTAPEDVRFIVQAAGGNGLVSLDANKGVYHAPGATEASIATSLELEVPPTSGAFGSEVTLVAFLRDESNQLIDGERVRFNLGPLTRSARTVNGRAEVTITLLANPGSYAVNATYGGSPLYLPSSVAAASQFTITTQDTIIDLVTMDGSPGDSGLAMATLQDALGRNLIQKSVLFEVTGANGSYSESVITDLLGRASLGSLDLPTGTYNVKVSYPGTDHSYKPSMATGTITLNAAPVCDDAYADVQFIWPPNNNRFIRVKVLGVTDPENDPISITIDAIRQDEPVGTDFYPDGKGIGSDTAEVRAERDGSGNGRVYHIFFTASDSHGNSCSISYPYPGADPNKPGPDVTSVRVMVSDNQGQGIDPFDGGALYDSTATP